MGRYRVSGKARKMQIISLFRDVVFVCLTGVVWFRGDLGGKKARIFIHKKKRAIIPVLICPSTLGVWTYSSVCFGFSTDFFLEVPWSFWKGHHVRNCWNKSFQQFRNSCFLGHFAVVLSAASFVLGKFLRLSNGTPWERQLWILLRGGGREMDLFTATHRCHER